MLDRPAIGDGDVTIILDGEEVVLKASYGAARIISSRHGGIAQAMEKVMRLDVETCAEIIAFGMGYFPPKRPPSDLPERVWRTGLTDDTGRIAEHCVAYLSNLGRGGRPMSDDAEEAPDDLEDPTTRTAE